MGLELRGRPLVGLIVDYAHGPAPALDELAHAPILAGGGEAEVPVELPIAARRRPASPPVVGGYTPILRPQEEAAGPVPCVGPHHHYVNPLEPPTMPEGVYHHQGPDLGVHRFGLQARAGGAPELLEPHPALR